MDSREQLAKRGRFQGHGRRRYEEWYREEIKWRAWNLYWGLVPDNHQVATTLSSSIFLDIMKVKAFDHSNSGTCQNIHFKPTH